MTRRPPQPRSAYHAFREIQTRWKDNDTYGHINNVTYLSYFDTVVSLWQIEQGMEIAQEGGLRFLVVESGATYHAEARFPDVLHAGIRVGRLGTSSVRFEIGIFRNDEDIACVEGFFVHVAVDPDTRPTPIPDTARARLEGIMVKG
ncbi:thioesterase superfamily protein [Citreicella sp. SE45]|nr:thioesterase superfamily protein [Citreicella sp. SE45]